MAQNLGHSIYRLRSKLNLSQKNFGCLIGTSAMNVSRYERDQHPVPSHVLLKLGGLAKQAGMDGWVYLRLVGVTPEEARAMLGRTRAATGKGRR